MKHVLAVDYDGTITANPGFFNALMVATIEHGITVYIVTLRNSELDKIPEEETYTSLGIPVIYCDGKPKRQVCTALGIRVSWWIDDNPECIYKGSPMNSDQLAGWRRERLEIVRGGYRD